MYTPSLLHSYIVLLKMLFFYHCCHSAPLFTPQQPVTNTTASFPCHSHTHPHTALNNHTDQPHNNSSSIMWANVYPGPSSATVPLECHFQGNPICCSALRKTNKREKLYAGVPLVMLTGLQREGECNTKKEYFPSPYETRHLLKAREIAQVADLDDRRRLLVEFISLPDEITGAQKWLERVRVHMNMAREDISQRKGRHKSAHMQRLRNVNADSKGRLHGKRANWQSNNGRRRTTVIDRLTTIAHPDDAEYMSKFIVTTTCEGGAYRQWVDWIEPLSVHARHPFGMQNCAYGKHSSCGQEMAKSGVPNIKEESKLSTDYVLLKKVESLPEYEVTPSKTVRKTKKVLFDAGTSRFDSSLYWFTCAFSQRFINFDSIFGWEYSLLNPRDFWSHVPPRWKPLYHFFNKGITSSPTEADSVQTLMRQLGVTKNDFVAFKLDIDTPSIEIPIAMDLLNEDAGFGDLIDEFFFELHFRCEIMMTCGWDSEMPDEFNGLRMDRYGALQFFGDLRRRGIRAHFWP